MNIEQLMTVFGTMAEAGFSPKETVKYVKHLEDLGRSIDKPAYWVFEKQQDFSKATINEVLEHLNI